MLNKTYNKEFKMEDVPEELLVENTQDYFMARLKEKIQYYLKYQYKPVDISKRCSPKLFDDIAKHNLVQKSLKRKNKRWNKKKKHLKDKLNHMHNCKGKAWYRKMEEAYYGKDNPKISTIRAQKVYLPEEYYDMGINYWFDEEVCETFHPTQQFPTEYSYLAEIGLEHFSLEFDWSPYVDSKGVVLGSYAPNTQLQEGLLRVLLEYNLTKSIEE